MTLKSAFLCRAKRYLASPSCTLWIFGLVLILQRGVSQVPVVGFVYSEQGLPLADVRVYDAGKNVMTLTDSLGFFSMRLLPGGTLVFSAMGYMPETYLVEDGREIRVTLRQGVVLPDVVVTALGIERPAASVSFAQQNLSGTEISKTFPASITQALSGQVAGLIFSQSSAGLGASSRVILRGNRSLNGNNQPLYVVDGIPISNFNLNPASALGGFDYGDGISNLNPGDIESISVLKGPSAAALYGTRANNGVILISTLQGDRSGRISLEYHSAFQLEFPFQLRSLQQQFGQGNGGVYNRRSEQNWGPPLDGRMVQHWSQESARQEEQYPYLAHPDNYLDFYRAGSRWINMLKLMGGGDRMRSYFSYAFTDANGIVPTNGLQSHQVSYRANLKIHEKLLLDSRINYVFRKVDDRQPTGENYANTSRQILRIPRNISLAEASHYEYLNNEGQNRQNYWNPGSTSGENPYWTLHRNKVDDERNRVTGFAKLTFNPVSRLSLMARTGLDRTFDNIEHRFYNDTYVLAPNGNYFTRIFDILEWNTDFLATFRNIVPSDWHFELNAGGSLRTDRLRDRQLNSGGLIKENFFSFDNGRNPDVLETGVKSQLNSLYAFGWVSYQDKIFLEASGRNDWSSTLPREQWSYFYPSVGTSVLMHELVTLPSWISRMKIRASYALVGNDIRPYLTNFGYGFASGGNLGYLSRTGVQPFLDLNPELTRSVEVGLDLGFAQERTGLDITWYRSNSTNQLFTVPLPVASGWTSRLINAGNIQNTGIELMARLDVLRTEQLQWSTSVNFAANQSKVISLTEEVKSFRLASDFMNTVQVDEGGEYGEIYSRGFVRNEQGQVLVGPDGLPQITPGHSVHLGNFNPDWTGGLENRLHIKSFTIDFLIDFRQGGVVTSFTNANLYADGSAEGTLAGRYGNDHKVVILDPMGNIRAETQGSDGLIIQGVKVDGAVNDIVVKTEDFWRKVGARNTAVGEAFTSSASHIRLREFSVKYSIPEAVLSNRFVRSIDVAFFGRNLFFISNKADGFDPELVVGAGNATQGLESFALPATRSLGVQLNVFL